MLRLNDYYSRLVRDARSGRPSIGEAHADMRQSLEARLRAHLMR